MGKPSSFDPLILLPMLRAGVQVLSAFLKEM